LKTNDVSDEHVTCILLRASRWFLPWHILHHEDGDNMFLPIVRLLLADYTALYNRRWDSLLIVMYN
jgi:hypothetical protein